MDYKLFVLLKFFTLLLNVHVLYFTKIIFSFYYYNKKNDIKVKDIKDVCNYILTIETHKLSCEI